VLIVAVSVFSAIIVAADGWLSQRSEPA